MQACLLIFPIRLIEQPPTIVLCDYDYHHTFGLQNRRVEITTGGPDSHSDDPGTWPGIYISDCYYFEYAYYVTGSLIGRCIHAGVTGSGYDFLVSCILDLADINSQISAYCGLYYSGCTKWHPSYKQFGFMQSTIIIRLINLPIIFFLAVA